MTQVNFKGTPVSLSGKLIALGDIAPEAKVVNTSLEEVIIGGKKDSIQIINVVPSLDTPVCSLQAKRFNVEALSNGYDITFVSMDLPFAMARFGSEYAEKLKMVSDFRHHDFAKNFGLEISEGVLMGLLARCVMIINTQGKVVYLEVVEEITSEPNYTKALDFLKTL